MPTVAVPGARIHYELKGAGEPLLLLRGYGSHSGWWEPSFIEALAERFSLILYDHRGTGRSGHLKGDYSIRLLADDAACLLVGVGIEPAHVFGLSMGGMVAQELALNYPALVGTLVPGATHCGGRHAVMPAPEVLSLLESRAKGAEVGEEWLRTVFTPGFPRRNPEAAGAYVERSMDRPVPAETVRMQANAVAAFDTWERLPRLRNATCILHGEHDVIVPPANARILAERIPGARVVMLRGLGHDFTAQDPRAAARALLDNWDLL